jgi:hypothetical protein
MSRRRAGNRKAAALHAKKNGPTAAFSLRGRTGRTAFVALPASHPVCRPRGWLPVLNPTMFLVSGYPCNRRLGTFRFLPRSAGCPLIRSGHLAMSTHVSVMRLRPPPPTLGEARTSFSRAVAFRFPCRPRLSPHTRNYSCCSRKQALFLPRLQRPLGATQPPIVGFQT